jgi:hypothetical protein
MTEHWTVAALGEDLGERDPYEIIDLLRARLADQDARLVAWDKLTERDLAENARLRAQLAAITTARDEAATAYAERVRVLREALDDFREYALRPDGDAVWVGGSHHNPIWARVAAVLDATK